MADGYIKLYRSLLESPIAMNKGGSLGWLWVVLLLKARHCPGYGKGSQYLERGQLVASVRELAQESGLTEKTVRGHLKKLETLDSIRAESRANRYHLISIENWDLYQRREVQVGKVEGRPRADLGQTKGKLWADQTTQDADKARDADSKNETREEWKECNSTPSPSPPLQAGGRRVLGERIKEIVSEEEAEGLLVGKCITSRSDHDGQPMVVAYSGYENQLEAFEAFWDKYPNKRGRDRALREWRTLQMNSFQVARISFALRYFALGEKDAAGNEYIYPSPSRWLREQRWEDDIATQDEETLEEWEYLLV